ncbi:DmsC/YnfH family molybdoenzyme membrane anchor subunit [Polynucleobacter sp. MWH-Braz-FAM2G]|uniref:dimethyl sulfoxide reductase anchor subunit family protein n=1 Tax=Polynucleobacter sp. MWH-Braz-FAM2G TaxID=1855883 RepID=UPI001BFD928C|nr:DmsC/YnfH family molybdoenzyme membrane anchor subunit [Polynucleobacter sp. MWH-Braz-FAM2G]QWD91252.1 dimethyl sulfoxide reductase anchor subunit [Polynucleobacter sp. MWH-Braz-FAM2G]
MRPQFSIIFFTTLAGMAQGLLFFIALSNLYSQATPNAFLTHLALPVAFALLALGLVASFFHLGHPERAWRAAMMWRTSWLSREVIALPALMGATLVTYFYAATSQVPQWLWLALLVTTFALWICTAKIYQCIRFIQEWSHPSTLSNFILLGMTSGWLLLELLIALWGDDAFQMIDAPLSIVAFILLFLSFNLKLWMWRRNRHLKPKSNLSSATGIKGSNIRQTSMGLMGGSFNTREFFHHQTDRVIANIRKIILLCAYVIPMVLMAYTITSPNVLLIGLALFINYLGLLAERWMFFAEANHPQNLYYQRVS